jgi:hypothetical protein
LELAGSSTGILAWDIPAMRQSRPNHKHAATVPHVQPQRKAVP